MHLALSANSWARFWCSDVGEEHFAIFGEHRINLETEIDHLFVERARFRFLGQARRCTPQSHVEKSEGKEVIGSEDDKSGGTTVGVKKPVMSARRFHAWGQINKNRVFCFRKSGDVTIEEFGPPCSVESPFEFALLFV